jgi:ATP-binding cassette, subfamily G (WHITE), member 2
VYRAAGFPCPVHANPADHLLDVITPPRSNPLLGTTSTSLEQQQAIDEAIMRGQPPFDVDLNMGVNKRLVQMANLPVNPSWPKQVQILFGRTMQEQYRQLGVFITSMIQTVIISILIGTVFLQIGTGQKSVVRREPALFFCAVNQGIFGALMVINSFPVERALSLRERASGSYCASSYFIAKILAETLVQLPVPIIFVSDTVFHSHD